MEHKLMTQIKKLQQINSNWEYKGKYGYIVDQDTGETICQQSDEKRGKLIASAPDLLEACEKALQYFERNINEIHLKNDPKVIALRESINKATK